MEQPPEEVDSTQPEEKPSKQKGKKKGVNEGTLAEKADRHVLYQISVQSPKKDAQFFVKVFHGERHRKPLSLREDFCGTAMLCYEWVRADIQRTAVGIDLSEEVLAWGRKHNSTHAGPASDRVQLVHANVMDLKKISAEVGADTRFDVLAALNFSMFLLHKRRDLLKYLSSARQALKEDGMLFLDVLGGFEAQAPSKFRKKFDSFTYIFETEYFNIIDSTTSINISFRMSDGSWLKKAFQYDWRLWSLAELKDALTEVGFKHVRIWWSDLGEDGDNEFNETRNANQTENWLAYIAAYD